MPNSDLLVQAKDLADQATARASEYSEFIPTAREYIVDHFGQTGLVAAYIAIGALLIFVGLRLVSMTLSTLKYLVVPSVALAFLATIFLPYSFGAALPASVTVCSLVLLFKG